MRQFIVLALTVLFVHIEKCNTFLHIKSDFGYRNIDVDGFLSTPRLAKKYGYKCEEHVVVTQDGYVLKMFRLVGRLDGQKVSESSPTVLLMHGIFSSSTALMLNGQNSPAGIMSDYGFDIWMGNVRGTRYSRNHTRISPESPEFWKFQYNEMVLFDLTSFVDYILKYVDKPSLHYVGYSQGGILMGALLGTRNDYNEKIKSISFVGSSLIVKPFKWNLLDTSIRVLDILSRKNEFTKVSFEILRYTHVNMRLIYKLCNIDSTLFELCLSISEAVLGKDKHTDLKRLPYYLGQSDAVSSNQLFHLSQVYTHERVALYDFGHSTNARVYGQENINFVNLSTITSPKLFVYSAQDRVMQKDGVLETVRSTVNVKNVVELEGYNHLGFLYALDIKRKVYDHVANHIKQQEFST